MSPIPIFRFRKKPVAIWAAEVRSGEADYLQSIAKWCGGRVVASDEESGSHLIAIDTLEGTMYADDGDWIIREPFPTDDRCFYPCKPDIFAKTYEADR